MKNQFFPKKQALTNKIEIKENKYNNSEGDGIESEVMNS